ncbi:MAG: replication initiation protein [Shewanella sp.]|jgi:plasmid replication initiation protein
MEIKNLTMSRHKKIYHRNDARPALARMGLAARRLLYLVLAQQKKDEHGKIQFQSDRTYIVTAKDYSELCDVSESLAYRQLKSGVREIRTYLMEVSSKDLVKTKEFDVEDGCTDEIIMFTVANYGVYSDGGGYVKLKLDPIIAPYISNLRGDFTGQLLLSAVRIPDSNANTLYTLLREWVSSGMYRYKDISVADFKIALGVSDIKTYLEFKDFKKLFFNRAVSSLIKNTEFSSVDMDIIERVGRKASVVRVSYEYSEQDKHKKDADLASIVPASKAEPEVRPSKRALEMMKEVENLKK